MYEGPSDAIRLRSGGPLGPEVLNRQANFVCGGGTAVELPPGVRPLWADDDRDAIIASLPDCDEWGIESHWKPPGTISIPGTSSSRLPVAAPLRLHRRAPLSGEKPLVPSQESSGHWFLSPEQVAYFLGEDPTAGCFVGPSGGSSPRGAADDEEVEDAAASSSEPPPRIASRKLILGESLSGMMPDDS